ncbi:MAG: DUF177 domain-containing protein [Gammaproteobacteria bacterium]|nr:DUF177 domain-containing protein [Gammaproteobacteria bacterium]
MNRGKLPKTLDPLHWALGQRIAGCLSIAAMPRLSASLQDKFADVNVELLLTKDQQEGLYCLQGHLATVLSLVCQRCMETMSYSIAADFIMYLVANEEQAKRLPEEYVNKHDIFIHNNELIDTNNLVEDELILQLPLVVKHDDKNCNDQLSSEDSHVSFIEKSEKRNNPFAILHTLKSPPL